MNLNEISPKLGAAGVAALALALLGGTAACAAPVTNATVAFLMPDQSSTRYEEHDHPGFVAEMKKLCPDCKVLYQNADGDASRQQQQFNSVVSQGAKAIVLDPVDSTAAASLVKQAQSQGIKVIAYDRPIPSTPADYYVSFNNEEIGKSIAKSLVDHLQGHQSRRWPMSASSRVNGSPTDAAAGLIKKGIHAGILPTGGYATLAEYDTPEWASLEGPAMGRADRCRGSRRRSSASSQPTTAQRGAAVAAFKAAGVDPVPTRHGQRCHHRRSPAHHFAGDQYNTISKPSEIVAAAAQRT